jgi:3-oxosteroid 1-dehydrogenase
LAALVLGAADPLALAERLQLPHRQHKLLAQVQELRRRLAAVPAIRQPPSWWCDWLEAPGLSPEAVALALAAMRLGAAVTLMDDSWWHVSVVFPDGGRTVLMWERTFPGSIIVDPAGQRFANEAAPYNDLGRAMMERLRQFDTKHCWLIMDARHRRNYVFTNILGGVNPRELIDKGFFVKAASLDEMAAKCSIPADDLKATITRFNGFARSGRDEDFNRGESLFDTIYGDEKVTPNPTLGPIENAPFWAVKVYASDLGTKGGLLTDEDGRVLAESGEPIAGLYASGNTTASLMGRGYPGPGSTLGPAGVFAYRAARHAAMQAG